MDKRVVTLGDEHRDQLARRQLAAARLVAATPGAAARISAAPAGYMLAHDSIDIARHAALLSPLPTTGEVRVLVTPGPARDQWCVDVASHDRPGLLAAFSGVLLDSGVEVAQAVLATWDDGGALEAFVVISPGQPDRQALQLAFVASLSRPLSSPPITDAIVTFDDEDSALYTCCDVRAGDRRGLLRALAVAIATAGVDVHAASVTTRDGLAHDRFDLSDRYGHRLDPSSKEAIRSGVFGGASVGGKQPRVRSTRRYGKLRGWGEDVRRVAL